MKDYGLLQKTYLVQTYPNRGLVFAEGDGVYLQDVRRRALPRRHDQLRRQRLRIRASRDHRRPRAAGRPPDDAPRELRQRRAGRGRPGAHRALRGRAGPGLLRQLGGRSERGGAQVRRAGHRQEDVHRLPRGLPRKNPGRPLGDGRGQDPGSRSSRSSGISGSSRTATSMRSGQHWTERPLPSSSSPSKGKAASASPRRAFSGRRRASAGKPERSSSSTRSRREPAGPAGSSARRPRA